MSMCPNCKASLGCSCKLRKTPKGNQVCTNCLSLAIAQGK